MEEQERARREQARVDRERRQQGERRRQLQQLSRMREEEELRRRGETGDGASLDHVTSAQGVVVVVVRFGLKLSLKRDWKCQTQQHCSKHILT